MSDRKPTPAEVDDLIEWAAGKAGTYDPEDDSFQKAWMGRLLHAEQEAATLKAKLDAVRECREWIAGMVEVTPRNDRAHDIYQLCLNRIDKALAPEEPKPGSKPIASIQVRDGHVVVEEPKPAPRCNAERDGGEYPDDFCDLYEASEAPPCSGECAIAPPEPFEDFVIEVARGPYPDSDPASLLETYTKRARALVGPPTPSTREGEP